VRVSAVADRVITGLLIGVDVFPTPPVSGPHSFGVAAPYAPEGYVLSSEPAVLS